MCRDSNVDLYCDEEKSPLDMSVPHKKECYRGKPYFNPKFFRAQVGSGQNNAKMTPHTKKILR